MIFGACVITFYFLSSPTWILSSKKYIHVLTLNFKSCMPRLQPNTAAFESTISEEGRSNHWGINSNKSKEPFKNTCSAITFQSFCFCNKSLQTEVSTLYTDTLHMQSAIGWAINSCVYCKEPANRHRVSGRLESQETWEGATSRTQVSQPTRWAGRLLMYFSTARMLTLLLENVWWWMLVDELRRQLSCPRDGGVHRVWGVGEQSMVMMHVMGHVGGRMRRRMHGRMEFSRVWQHHHFANSIFFHHLSSNVRNGKSVQKQACKHCIFNKESPGLSLHPAIWQSGIYKQKWIPVETQHALLERTGVSSCQM